jgi:hypothetical protein
MIIASGLAGAIKKRGDKTPFDAASSSKSSAFFQWVTACQLVFQLACQEAEWQSTLRDLDLYNSSKPGFMMAFTQFKAELPPFINGNDALANVSAHAVATSSPSSSSSSSMPPLTALTSPAARQGGFI